jgi:hypothetical protein
MLYDGRRGGGWGGTIQASLPGSYGKTTAAAKKFRGAMNN